MVIHYTSHTGYKARVSLCLASHPLDAACKAYAFLGNRIASIQKVTH